MGILGKDKKGLDEKDIAFLQKKKNFSKVHRIANIKISDKNKSWRVYKENGTLIPY